MSSLSWSTEILSLNIGPQKWLLLSLFYLILPTIIGQTYYIQTPLRPHPHHHHYIYTFRSGRSIDQNIHNLNEYQDTSQSQQSIVHFEPPPSTMATTTTTTTANVQQYYPIIQQQQPQNNGAGSISTHISARSYPSSQSQLSSSSSSPAAATLNVGNNINNNNNDNNNGVISNNNDDTISAPSSATTTSSTSITSSSTTVIKHPSTCSYDRSQTACTFSLLCYLANGVPIEGCEENPSLTCCYIRLKNIGTSSSSLTGQHYLSANQLSSKTDNSNIVYRPYSTESLPSPSVMITHTPSQSSQNSIYSGYPNPHHHHHYNHLSPSNYLISTTSTSISNNNNGKYRNTNTPLISSDSSVTSVTKIHNNNKNHQNYPQHHSQHHSHHHQSSSSNNNKYHQSNSNNNNNLNSNNDFDQSFNLKNDLLSPYEPQSGNYNSQHEFDYAVNNAIRRTRPDNMKSVFQEIVNRKYYARNYNIEDICGKPMSKPRSRIIGGQDAYFGEFPWQVHIKITKHQCGGALINSRYIVTAAHCIYQAPIHQLNVIIGAHDIEDHRFQDIPPQYFRVSRVILHPNFRFSASHPDRYDIALIKLDSPVRFSDSVLPVCLPEENLKFEGRKGVVTGWGKTDPALSNRYGTRLLQKVDVPIIDNEKCETWHRTRGIDLRIFSEMMCAGYEDGQKDACVGDSGGPLVININGRWTLAGITSAGFGCAQSRQPGIYHRVSHTVEWVRQTLREEEENNLI